MKPPDDSLSHPPLWHGTDLWSDMLRLQGICGMPGEPGSDACRHEAGIFGARLRAERPARVLIVEDEGLVALSTAQILSDAGYEVVGLVASADAAVRAADEYTPDLVLMDIALHGHEDGVEAARQIRSRHDPKILFITAHGDAQTRSRADEVEPVGFLSKPYDGFRLLRAIRSALDTRS